MSKRRILSLLYGMAYLELRSTAAVQSEEMELSSNVAYGSVLNQKSSLWLHYKQLFSSVLITLLLLFCAWTVVILLP